MMKYFQLAVLLSVCAFVSLVAAEDKERYEQPVLPPVTQLLPPALLSGPHFRVHNVALNDGYFTSYKIVSDYGEFDVEGQQLLEVRVAEVAALSELTGLSSSKVFADAAVKAGKATVMAPVRLVEKTYDRVTDPEKALATLESIPEGAEKLFSWAYRQAKGVTHAASDAVAPAGPTATPHPLADDDKVSSTLNQGKKLGLDFIGYSKREREWFKKLKVNPYTTNQVLRSEVERVSAIETGVGVGFRFVPGLGLLGQLGTVNRWYDRAEKLALYEEPSQIKRKNVAELEKLGIAVEQAAKFLKNKAYGPWSQRFVVASLSAIGPHVEGQESFIRAACEATNEPSALYFVSVAEALEKIHEQQKLRRIVASMYLPAGVTAGGKLIVPLSVDYLFWTKEVAGVFEDFKTRVLKEAAFNSVEIRVRGNVSTRARAELAKLGAKVVVGALW